MYLFFPTSYLRRGVVKYFFYTIKDNFSPYGRCLRAIMYACHVIPRVTRLDGVPRATIPQSVDSKSAYSSAGSKKLVIIFPRVLNANQIEGLLVRVVSKAVLLRLFGDLKTPVYSWHGKRRKKREDVFFGGLEKRRSFNRRI